LRLQFLTLATYGSCEGPNIVPPLRELFEYLMQRTSPVERLQLYRALEQSVEKQRTGINAVMPFLLIEKDPGIVSTAAIDFAHLTPAVNGDPLSGVAR
jgi:hypothetical protein